LNHSASDPVANATIAHLHFKNVKLVQRSINTRPQTSRGEYLALIRPFEWLGHGLVEVVDEGQDLAL